VKILVFGATGPTGQQVVTQALGQGHAVTAFVRNPARLSITDERLRVAVGDTTRDASTVADAVRAQDVVVSALGRRSTLTSDRLIERSMQAIVPAMERTGVRRLILVSAFGVGESYRDAPLIPRIMYKVLLHNLFADKKTAEDFVRRSSLEWTIVYPVLLTDGPLTGIYRAGERLDLRGMPKISRADVAHFILAETENRGFVGKVAIVSY
jgi:putative NADH-flavin reductase